ncbi:class I SAM-dependent methyltransferase [Acidisoma sp.]|uniref:class I SAM-dependent methyltransferase n=1 Tax=Acidisoma sp. TaxID=1872115 RepID=UPI003B000C44
MFFLRSLEQEVRQIFDLTEIDDINRAFDDEADCIKQLVDVFWLPPSDGSAAPSLDPFSEQFKSQATARLNEITGRLIYDASENEKAPYLSDVNAGPVVPSHYTVGDSAWAGEFIQAHGAVLKALAMRSGQRILEYGPGDGQIILHLCRMKCKVTAIDIERRYLSRIQSQAAALQLDLVTLEGEFGDSEEGVLYDRILFFEAFHHALNHHDLVRKLAKLLQPDGYIVLAGEPVLERDNYYRQTLPYAWGPRLDGLSLRVMRTYGWCELGFAREYFIELWMRAGFLVTFMNDAASWRGSAYIARPNRALTVDITGPCLLEAWGFPDCWHPGEGNLRWSKSEASAIPLDGSRVWRHVTINLQNALPLDKKVQVTSGSFFDECLLAPGSARTITIPYAQVNGRVVFNCAVHRPCDLSAESLDSRELGFAIIGMVYDD